MTKLTIKNKNMSRQKMKQELWCRVYASVMGRQYHGSVDALEAANQSVEHFNKRYPCEDYGYNLPD
jgi:hypothetical protein